MKIVELLAKGPIKWTDPDGIECVLKLDQRLKIGYSGAELGNSKNNYFHPSKYDEALHSAILAAHSSITEERVRELEFALSELIGAAHDAGADDPQFFRRLYLKRDAAMKVLTSTEDGPVGE